MGRIVSCSIELVACLIAILLALLVLVLLLVGAALSSLILLPLLALLLLILLLPSLFIVLWVTLYVVARYLSKALKIDGHKDKSETAIEMPKLTPLIIDTKDQPSFLRKMVVFLACPRRWHLEEDWKYQLNPETTLVIEKGFIFDGASVPRIFWAILSPTGLLLIRD